MNKIINYRITNDSIIRIILWAGLAYCMFYFRDLILTLLVGLVLASTIDPVAKFFKKYKIPRVVTVSSIFIIMTAIVAVSISFVIPALADDFVRLIAKLPILLNEINIFGKDLGLKELSVYVTDLSRDISKGQILTVLKNSVIGAGSALNATGAVISSVVNFLLTLVFTFLFGSPRRWYQEISQAHYTQIL